MHVIAILMFHSFRNIPDPIAGPRSGGDVDSDGFQIPTRCTGDDTPIVIGRRFSPIVVRFAGLAADETDMVLVFIRLGIQRLEASRADVKHKFFGHHCRRL